jgi:hypothetical protein
VTRKASMTILSSSRPLSGKMVLVSNRSDRPSSRKRSPPQSPFFNLSRSQVAGSAECWPNTILNMFSCHLGRSPVSFVPWRMTWDWGLWRFTAYPVSVVRCTLLDRLANL